jgi:hypothetical protein
MNRRLMGPNVLPTECSHDHNKCGSLLLHRSGLSPLPVKCDRNDAPGIAQLLRLGSA